MLIKKEKGEFSDKFKAQVSKVNSFLQTWAKVKNVKGTSQEDFQKQIVVEFAPDTKTVIDFQSEFKHQLQYREMAYLNKAVDSIQKTLSKLFWPQPAPAAPAQPDFLVEMIESLWHESEAALNTFFRVDFDEEADEPLQLELQDRAVGDEFSENRLNCIRVYLTNVRKIAAILTHVLYNQFRILIQTRVIYDRELFNFEEYVSKCLADDRLINRILLATSTVTSASTNTRMPSGKYLMSEFFKLQKQEMSTSFDKLRTPNQIAAFLSHLASHVPKLYRISKKIDIEPVLLVYFSHLTYQSISKDSLSKVSKTFFKDLKMNYRALQADFASILCDMSAFFLGHESITVASFWQFMVAVTVDRVADEHAHFIFTILKDRTFTDQASLQKFQAELLVFNEFMWVLFHCNLEYNAFFAFRTLRDIQTRVKRFCEASDNRIERALERAIRLENAAN